MTNLQAVAMLFRRRLNQRRYNEPHHCEVAVIFTSTVNRGMAVHPRNAPQQNISYMSSNGEPWDTLYYFLEETWAGFKGRGIRKIDAWQCVIQSQTYSSTFSCSGTRRVLLHSFILENFPSSLSATATQRLKHLACTKFPGTISHFEWNSTKG